MGESPYLYLRQPAVEAAPLPGGEEVEVPRAPGPLGLLLRGVVGQPIQALAVILLVAVDPSAKS